MFCSLRRSFFLIVKITSIKTRTTVFFDFHCILQLPPSSLLQGRPLRHYGLSVVFLHLCSVSSEK